MEIPNVIGRRNSSFYNEYAEKILFFLNNIETGSIPGKNFSKYETVLPDVCSFIRNEKLKNTKKLIKLL